MAKANEVAALVNAAADKIEKVRTEIAALKAALENVELPQAANDALARLAAVAQAADDDNPDAPAPTPEG